MTALSQRPRAMIAAAVAAGTVLLSYAFGAPHAHAVTQRAISPGDAIRYITAAGADTCTLAFAFTAHSHTYGVTAGHCVANAGGYVTDVISGYRGTPAAATRGNHTAQPARPARRSATQRRDGSREARIRMAPGTLDSPSSRPGHFAARDEASDATITRWMHRMPPRLWNWCARCATNCTK
jgi:hypothetical protein